LARYGPSRNSIVLVLHIVVIAIPFLSRNGISLLHPQQCHYQALFFEVMAEKADQPCSTFLLRQCGQTMFSFSCSAMVKLFENVFLQP
jgi:hypothetical protein